MGLMDWWRQRRGTPGGRYLTGDGPWLRTLFEYAPDACFLCDLRGVFLDGNRAAEAMVGFDRRELIGKSFLDMATLLPKDQRAKALTLLARSAARRPTGPDELILQRRDGTRFVAEISSHPVEFRGEMVILGIARDVTDRSRVENLVRAQRDLSVALNATSSLDEALEFCLQTAIEVSAMDCGGIYVVDERGGLCLRAHCGVGERFRSAVSYFAADSPHARLVFEAEPMYVAVEDMPLPSETPYDDEQMKAVSIVPIRHDGRVVAVLNLASRNAAKVPQDARAAVEAIAGQIGGTVARIQATDRLRESEQTVQGLLDATDDVVVMLDADGIFLAANQEAARHVGMTPAQMVGLCAYDLFPPDVARRRREMAEKAVSERRPMRFSDEDHGRVYDNSVYPVFDASGSVAQVAIYTHDITDVTRAQQELEDSERRYRALVESMPAQLCRYGPDHKLTFVNPQFAAEQGQVPERLIGADAPELIAPERTVEAFRRIDALTPDDDTVCHENRVTNAAGDYRWHRWTTRACFDDQGQLTEYQSVGVDITERRVAERRLQSNLEFSRTLLDTIGSPVYYKNTDGIYIGCNRAFAETVLGVPADEVPGNSVLDFGGRIPADLAETYDAHDTELLQNPGTQTFEALVQCADGTRRTHVLSQATFNDAAGEVAGIVGVMLDISERERVEQDLRRERDFSNAIIQSSPTFFVALEPDGRVAMANQAFLQATGYQPDEVVGVDYVETFVMPEHRPGVAQQLRDVCCLPQSAVYTTRVQAKDGSAMVVECHCTPVVDASGELSFTIVIGVDLTERYGLESRLREVEKMEAIGVLAAGIAHDFNNILAAVMGRMSLMLAGSDIDEKTTRDIEQMNRACARGADLIQRLLTFSRQIEPDRRSISPAGAIEAAVRVLSAAMPEGIELRTEIVEDLFIVEADPHQLEQALVNLGLNAIDAMDDGGVLTVSARSVTVDDQLDHVRGMGGRGEYLLVAIGDTGPGISEEDLSHIFEPFYTAKRRAVHSGLGLAVVHGIVHAHGGFVRVDTQPDRGTVFELYLPAMEGAAPEDTPHETPASVMTSRSLTVLVVDDEPAVARLAADIIEHYGHHALIAGDGMEALDVFGERGAEIDLVLLDLIMPRMDGETCVAALRQLDAEIPIVIASGAMLGEATRRRLLENVDAFMGKPFTLETLIETIESVMARRAGAE